MSLQTQLTLIITSFFFGIFFEMLFTICHKLIYYKKKHIKFIFTFIFTLLAAMLYFYLLLKINNGTIHIYGLLFIIIGMVFFYFIYKKISFYKQIKK